MEAHRERPLWWSWMVATTVGELIGFAVPAVAGMAALSLIGVPDTPAPALAFFVILPLAGAGEGGILGFFQWRELRRPLPAVTCRVWAGATAAAAALAWVLGMLPSTIDAIISLPISALILLWAVVAVPLLCTIGVAQALVLRRSIDGARWWAVANVLGWLLGLPVTFIGPSLVPDGSPPVVWGTAFIISGLLMGAIVGATTGLALQRLLARNRRAGELRGERVQPDDGPTEAAGVPVRTTTTQWRRVDSSRQRR
jgi:hypothetical protein